MRSNVKSKIIDYVDIDEANDVDIIEVAEALGIRLRRSGSSYFMPCPHHIEKKNDNCSITNKRDKNVYKCFSCLNGGGPIQLVMAVKQCDFHQALIFIGKNFGLLQSKTIDVSDKTRGWQGLTIQEYDKFGLKSAYGEDIISYEEVENEIDPIIKINKYKYTLRDLAKDDSQLHDDLLIDKFSEKVLGLASGYSLISREKLDFIEYTEPTKSYLLSKIKEEIQLYQSLLKKGLMNINRYFEVCNIDNSNDKVS